MKREDLEEDIKEKSLFVGLSGEGKTDTSMYIAKIYAIAGKTVLYIDPEAGTDKTKKKIFGSLTDEELARIELVKVFNMRNMLKYMNGWEEEVNGKNVKKGIDFDLKVVDGLTTEIDLYKTRLTRKFVKKGSYEINGKLFSIDDPETFILPYNFFAKLYDQLKESLNVMLEHRYDLVCTTHPFKETDAQKALGQSVYQKFDSVVRYHKVLMPTGKPKWSSTIIKDRGGESPEKSNIVEDTSKYLRYYIKKFGLDPDETLKKLGKRFVKEPPKSEVNKT